MSEPEITCKAIFEYYKKSSIPESFNPMIWILEPLLFAIGMITKRDQSTVIRVRAEDNIKHVFLNRSITEKSKITLITIRQREPLSDEIIRSLNLFPNLKDLEIWCQLQNRSALVEYLPKNLEYLQIAGAWELPDMPRLNFFCINYSAIIKHISTVFNYRFSENLELLGQQLHPNHLKTVGA